MLQWGVPSLWSSSTLPMPCGTHSSRDTEICSSMVSFPNTLLTHLAMFLTVNFSHSPDLQDCTDIKGMLHRDCGDQSSTVLYLWQSEDTPDDARACWFCERDDGTVQCEPLAGGKLLIFDGRKYLHGVVPPLRTDPNYPWYGATLLRKNFVNGLDANNKNPKGTKRKGSSDSMTDSVRGASKKLKTDKTDCVLYPPKVIWKRKHKK